MSVFSSPDCSRNQKLMFWKLGPNEDVFEDNIIAKTVFIGLKKQNIINNNNNSEYVI